MTNALQPVTLTTGKSENLERAKTIPDLGIRIDVDGVWYYLGSPITRAPLVKLFASVLSRDAEGAYWLTTPAERGQIEVADAPFLAVALEARGKGKQQILSFRTNIDDVIEAGEGHPIRVYVSGQSEPRPYIYVRNALEARLTRPVFYELVDRGSEEIIGGRTRFGVWSKGQFFCLGNLADEN